MSTRANTLGAAAGVVAPSAVESAPKALVKELELQVDFVRQSFTVDGGDSQMRRTTPTWLVYAGGNDLRLPQPACQVPRRHAFAECCAHQRRVAVSNTTPPETRVEKTVPNQSDGSWVAQTTCYCHGGTWHAAQDVCDEAL